MLTDKREKQYVFLTSRIEGQPSSSKAKQELSNMTTDYQTQIQLC